jgi:hypothetical protein
MNFMYLYVERWYVLRTKGDTIISHTQQIFMAVAFLQDSRQLITMLLYHDYLCHTYICERMLFTLRANFALNTH